MNKFDAVVIGAGAAGLMCAIQAGLRGRKVLVLDHANKVGKKILMSGGGRCNFTNYHIEPSRYQSHNPHFVKSALSRYTQWDFIKLVEKHKIAYYEKTLGQLFCVNKSQEIVNLLLKEAEQNKVNIRLNTNIDSIQKSEYKQEFLLNTSIGKLTTKSLVIATGGLSIPTLGASPFAYKVAEQFNIKVWPTRAGLVPFTLNQEQKELYSPLTGIAIDCHVNIKDVSFAEALLFTHRGLSGPAMLQISSFWTSQDILNINLLPTIDLFTLLDSERKNSPKKQLSSVMDNILPKRVVETFIPQNFINKKMADCSNKLFLQIVNLLQNWQIKPNGTEGYRTAEVTLGGVDCNAVSSKTMEASDVPGLYFIGEALDVTGWLGGYNFQWAWSSGFVAGQIM
jgi:predicted Rossmann fold flavoprotein